MGYMWLLTTGRLLKPWNQIGQATFQLFLRLCIVFPSTWTSFALFLLSLKDRLTCSVNV